MSKFQKGPNYRTPFGPNEFLRSTQDVKSTSYTFSAAAMPTEDVDDVPQKVLRRGVVIAKITSGAESGKVGVYDPEAEDGREVVGNIVGLNHTFAPWTLLVRDIEIGVVYECTAVQAWCFEYDDGELTTLTNATADEMRGTKGLDIMFK